MPRTGARARTGKHRVWCTCCLIQRNVQLVRSSSRPGYWHCTTRSNCDAVPPETFGGGDFTGTTWPKVVGAVWTHLGIGSVGEIWWSLLSSVASTQASDLWGHRPNLVAPLELRIWSPFPNRQPELRQRHELASNSHVVGILIPLAKRATRSLAVAASPDFAFLVSPLLGSRGPGSDATGKISSSMCSLSALGACAPWGSASIQISASSDTR